jgi:hypothetical protein
MTQNSSYTKPTSVVARKLTSGLQYVSNRGSKVYKENGFFYTGDMIYKTFAHLKYVTRDDFDTDDV